MLADLVAPKTPRVVSLLLIYALMLVRLTLKPLALGAFGWFYAISAGLLNTVFWYLFLLSLAMPIDRRIEPALFPGSSHMMHQR